MRVSLLSLILAACPPKPADTSEPEDTDPPDTDGFQFDTDLGGECGDGIVDENLGEACDDHNNVDGDGCRADCTGLEVCGDGILDTAVGEVCDEAGLVECVCDAYCAVPTECGDVCCNTGQYCDGAGACMFGVAEEITLSPVKSLYASDPDDVWVGGTSGLVYRWEGVEWTPTEIEYFLPDGTVTDLFGFSTASGYELWMVSPQVGLVHKNEDGDLRPFTNFNLGGSSRYAIAAYDQLNAFAAGDVGTFNVWHDDEWEYVDQGSVYYRDLWVRDPENVYGVGVAAFDGGDSRIVHFNDNGDVFTTVHSDDEAALSRIWGADLDHIWACGELGRLWYWDGSVWAKQDLGTEAELTAIHGKDAEHVLLGAADGSLWRWDGSAWSTVYTNRTRAIQDIYALENGKDVMILEDGFLVRSVW